MIRRARQHNHNACWLEMLMLPSKAIEYIVLRICLASYQLMLVMRKKMPTYLWQIFRYQQQMRHLHRG